MAIEDAYILSSILAAAFKDTHASLSLRQSEAIALAFETFDAIRRPWTRRLVRESKLQGEFYDFEGDAGDDAKRVARELERKWEWIWDADLPGMAEEAEALLRRKLEAVGV
jgi:hypothetical protein